MTDRSFTTGINTTQQLYLDSSFLMRNADVKGLFTSLLVVNTAVQLAVELKKNADFTSQTIM